MGFRSSNFGSGDAPVSVSPTQQLAMSSFVSRTYGWMFMGLLITTLVSYVIASSGVVMNQGLMMGAIIAQFAIVLGLTMGFRRLSAPVAILGFLAYSALTGVTFSIVFLIYTSSSIANVFFITAGMFGGLALFGTVTKKDLTGIGTFVGMGLWGLILVGLVNMFMRSEALSLGLSFAAVLVFTGLTAYDAQRIRAMAYQSTFGDSAEGQKSSIMGALMLYLDFINLFWALLRLFGNRRD